MPDSRAVIRISGALALSAFLLAPIADAAAASQADIAMMKGADRQAKLEAGAKKEGEFTFYTSLLVKSGVRPLKKAFEKKYPFIKYGYVRATTSTIVQKILSEARAGSTRSDVSVGSGSASLMKGKVLEPYWTPGQAALPKGYVDKGGLWTSVRMSYNGIGYNSKLVSEAEAPKDWADLLDPKWKGKMVWQKALETGGPLTILHLQRIWGKKKAGEFFDKLAKQKVAASNASGRAVFDLVIAGEYHLQIANALHHVIRSKKRGAKGHFVSPDPVIARPAHAMLIKGAPHPYAAMLFLDYIISKEGQQLLANNEYLVAHPDVQPLPHMRAIVPRLNGKKEIVYTPADTLENSKELIAIYNKISR